MAYQSECCRREYCTLMQRLILPRVNKSHWGLESLGSSASEMNLNLHGKSTPKTLNDLQIK